MAKILHIDASSRSASSVTRQLSKELVDALTKGKPESEVKHRDLIKENVPYIHEADLGAIFTPPDSRTAEQKQLLAPIEDNLKSFIAADVYVFGVPMYNFSVPAVFKSFIDLSVIAGKTFAYDNGVPKPLLHNKKAYIVTASGGDYDSGPMSKMDFLEPYLRTIFGFIGIGDITFIKVQGHSEAEIATAVAAAKAKIEEIGVAHARAVVAV